MIFTGLLHAAQKCISVQMTSQFFYVLFLDIFIVMTIRDMIRKPHYSEEQEGKTLRQSVQKQLSVQYDKNRVTSTSGKGNASNEDHFTFILCKQIHIQGHHMLVGSKTEADAKVCERSTQSREISMKKPADLTHSL